MTIKKAFIILSFLHPMYISYLLCMEITTPIQQPKCVEFLHNNKIAIAGSNGFILFDYKTKKSII